MQQSPFALALLLALPLPLLAQSPLKLNQIQIIVTHNSYHAGIAPNKSKI